MKDRDSSKQEADHHAKNLLRTAWLMTILQAQNITVGIVATCNRRGPDLEPSITAEIAYYTHGSLITQNCQWKYLLRPTTSKIAITQHHQLLLQETAWPFLWSYQRYTTAQDHSTYHLRLTDLSEANFHEGIFKDSFTCTVEWIHNSPTSFSSQTMFLTKIWIAFFEKEPWKVKPPLVTYTSMDFPSFL